MSQVGFQLHTLREMDDDVPTLLRHVDEHGFDAVEFASGVHESDTDRIREALDETGLVPMGAHIGLSQIESELDALTTRFRAIGCNKFVIPHLSPDHFLTPRRVDRVARRLNTLSDRLQERGFELVVHNSREMHLPLLDQAHFERLVDADVVPRGVWTHLVWGLGRVTPGGQLWETPFHRLVGQTDSAVTFELDIGHVASAGSSPVPLLDFLGDRLTAIHVCDTDRSRWLPPDYEASDIGTGIVEIEEAVREAVDRDVDWIIVEHDYPTDPEQTLFRGFETVAPLIEQSRVG